MNRVRFMVFNVTFNNISVISCHFYGWNKLEKTTDKLYHISRILTRNFSGDRH